MNVAHKCSVHSAASFQRHVIMEESHTGKKVCYQSMNFLKKYTMMLYESRVTHRKASKFRVESITFSGFDIDDGGGGRALKSFPTEYDNLIILYAY